MVMTFLIYARFHEVIIAATNSSAVVRSTTDTTFMHRATVKIELELESAERECGGKGTDQRNGHETEQCGVAGTSRFRI